MPTPQSVSVNHLYRVANSAQNRRMELLVRRMAMACEFSVRLPAGTRRAADAGCAALDEVERLESRLSAYVEDSDISRWNRGQTAAVDPGVYSLLRRAGQLAEMTGRAFDAATGALVKTWGFYRGPRRVPSPSQIAAALAACGSPHLAFDDAQCRIQAARPGIEFNLGGVGKGFAIDRGLDLIRRRFGVRCALLQGGQSSLKGTGAPPGEPRGWPVLLGNRGGGRPAVRIWLRDRAMGTSAADRQFFTEGGRRFGHILDPRTGWPAEGLLSATAVAGSAAEADALSTAFFVMGAGETRRFCLDHPQYGAVLALPGEVTVVGNLDAEVIS